ncbi:hypothetical protein K505DRAFT_356970 [Melanomma pulvis-pyrius CBS 109.77]|uniref:Uncharacterized protein n=1 Tax=Melanomma pulvis-pyrius CBS 109.77 TaxID=1314802 RepID=A0A6A6XRA0_9PLEO|nr:hypothetical protein K505DRAFT_356970 [Melanomma pulvis-pyrius CBS 109.77]
MQQPHIPDQAAGLEGRRGFIHGEPDSPAKLDHGRITTSKPLWKYAAGTHSTITVLQRNGTAIVNGGFDEDEQDDQDDEQDDDEAIATGGFDEDERNDEQEEDGGEDGLGNRLTNLLAGGDDDEDTAALLDTVLMSELDHL